MDRPLITLTTDFGNGSPYVAQMKGVILSIHPHAEIVDITHGIEPQNIRQGALALDDACRWFPDSAIHVAVVDPGVGTGRSIVLAILGDRRFVAPDNGLLSLVASSSPAARIIELNTDRFWLPPVSSTFHGRDIMAPVAAHLARGVPPEEFGTSRSGMVLLDWPRATHSRHEWIGSVIAADSFGNLITNFELDEVTAILDAGSATIRCGDSTIDGIAECYADRPPGSLTALVGSSGRLEIAVVNGNAADRLGVSVGAEVGIRCRSE